MQLILLGGPASGKGTQAARLARHFDLEHVSTGDMLRQACAEGTELGLLVDGMLKEGQLVPDYLVVELVLDALDQHERLLLPRLADTELPNQPAPTLAQAHG